MEKIRKMPKKPDILPVIVGISDDFGPEKVEFRHNRTLAPRVEEYLLVWPSGFSRQIVRSDAELADHATRGKAHKIKKKHEPGAERYARNPHEPIKC
jgi:hypothetical protein